MENEDKKKGTQLIRGRYENPTYVEAIKAKFEDRFPDNVPKDFIIDHVIRFFWDYVEEELKSDREVKIYAFGKFYVRSGVSNRTKKFQYYTKFKFSRHFNLRYRSFKGTASESELAEIAKKREFMEQVWKKRREYTVAKRGKLPTLLENYGV